MWEIAGYTSKGMLEINDDRISINAHVVEEGVYECVSEDSCFAFVCDGVGGEKCGYVAATLATYIFSDIANMSITPELINKTTAEANQTIIKKQCVDSDCADMATTVAGLFLSGDKILLFNVGDSRVYRFRPPYISLLSWDHSLVAENERAGLPIFENQRHVITRYLGGKSWKPYILEQQDAVGDNDIFLICTDGIWDYVTDSQFEKVLNKGTACTKICKELVSVAHENETDDNMSIIVIRRKM